jgi:glycosyltransferase involved in cell wall biosynthesis
MEVSIIIPACHEEKTIEPALLSPLNQEYENIEIIVVNDRSTDKASVKSDFLSPVGGCCKSGGVQFLSNCQSNLLHGEGFLHITSSPKTMNLFYPF